MNSSCLFFSSLPQPSAFSSSLPFRDFMPLSPVFFFFLSYTEIYHFFFLHALAFSPPLPRSYTSQKTSLSLFSYLVAFSPFLHFFPHLVALRLSFCFSFHGVNPFFFSSGPSLPLCGFLAFIFIFLLSESQPFSSSSLRL